MKRVLLPIFFLVSMLSVAQTKLSSQTEQNILAPKLVVGIVVDQMRYDYLTRFYDYYGEGGFKRLMQEGFNFKNNHYSYLPTNTAPGHTSIFSGTPPAVHGIIGNNWYDKNTDNKVYCVQDDNVQPLGTENSAGKMSPHRMLTTSIADEIKIATQKRGKVIGIALKDRAAILPVGHSADAAYWFRGKNEGNWISSTYYRNQLPQWVKNFNASRKVESYMNQVWDTFYDIQTYTQSDNDDVSYERKFKGTEKSVFPYDLAKLREFNDNYDLIRVTPFGNSFTVDFAFAAIEGEQLGKDQFTDFISISFSSPDYIGHDFGTQSKEIHDNYIRLDKDLERLLTYLDKNIEKNEYLVFVCADHGAMHPPGYLLSANIPAGFFDYKLFENYLKENLLALYGIDDLIVNISNDQIFLNQEVIKAQKLNRRDVENTIADLILPYPKIDKVFTRTQLDNKNFDRGMGYLVQNGFNEKRSGDVIFTLIPGQLSVWYEDGGTGHGSGYTYDTHVPLLFFGHGIKPGFTYQKSEIIDIAPTVSALLGISFPSGSTGRVLTELFE